MSSGAVGLLPLALQAGSGHSLDAS